MARPYDEGFLLAYTIEIGMKMAKIIPFHPFYGWFYYAGPNGVLIEIIDDLAYIRPVSDAPKIARALKAEMEAKGEFHPALRLRLMEKIYQLRHAQQQIRREQP